MTRKAQPPSRATLAEAVDVLARNGLIVIPADQLAALREQAAAASVDNNIDRLWSAITGTALPPP